MRGAEAVQREADESLRYGGCTKAARFYDGLNNQGSGMDIEILSTSTAQSVECLKCDVSY